MNEVAMCGQLQNSITACVYFLAPHRVKKVDLILISAISQLVSQSGAVFGSQRLVGSWLFWWQGVLRRREGLDGWR